MAALEDLKVLQYLYTQVLVTHEVCQHLTIVLPMKITLILRKWYHRLKALLSKSSGLATTSPIIPEELPFLEAICWQTKDVYRFQPEEMLRRYERGWRYHSLFKNLEGQELDFLKQLAKKYDSWLQADL